MRGGGEWEQVLHVCAQLTKRKMKQSLERESEREYTGIEAAAVSGKLRG